MNKNINNKRKSYIKKLKIAPLLIKTNEETFIKHKHTLTNDEVFSSFNSNTIFNEKKKYFKKSYSKK